jgi:hypothetical protein
MSRILIRTSQLVAQLKTAPRTSFDSARTFTMVGTAFVWKPSIITNSLQSGPLNKENILAWAGKDGEFKRQQSQFRNFVENKPGAQFPPEKDRYHLYVSYACPWGEH